MTPPAPGTAGHDRYGSVTRSDPRTFRPQGPADRQRRKLFLRRAARDRDDNLLFVQQSVIDSRPDRSALLDLYGRVLRGRRLSADETDPLVTALLLAGLVRLAT